MTKTVKAAKEVLQGLTFPVPKDITLTYVRDKAHFKGNFKTDAVTVDNLGNGKLFPGSEVRATFTPHLARRLNEGGVFTLTPFLEPIVESAGLSAGLSNVLPPDAVTPTIILNTRDYTFLKKGPGSAWQLSLNAAINTGGALNSSAATGGFANYSGRVALAAVNPPVLRKAGLGQAEQRSVYVAVDFGNFLGDCYCWEPCSQTPCV